MIQEKLFDEILINPSIKGANTLYIVTGYASPGMASRHFEAFQKLNRDLQINLLIGMTPYDGISIGNHKGFVRLVETNFPKSFVCSYLLDSPPVHSKIYSWYQDDKPIQGFIGSANYSQKAFSNMQREIMEECDPEIGLDYFNGLIGGSIYCNHNDTENLIRISNNENYQNARLEFREQDEGIDGLQNIHDSEIITISFLDNNNNLPPKSGLNWGQREKRNRNEAYIRIPSKISKLNFFPPKNVHFTVITDDNKALLCSIAQSSEKAISTPSSNSLMGEYFRNRLNLANGAFINKTDLLNYGRTDVNFQKIDDETFYMDFSVT